MSVTPEATQTPIPQGVWRIDPAHSKVGFAVKHMGVATVRGEFEQFDGSLVVGTDLASSKATGSVQTASVDTKQEPRDNHLRSADFFEVDKYPELTFSSTSIERVDDETVKITGDLTMHGETHPIELEAELGGIETGPEGETRTGLEVTGQLSRGDWGMKFSAALGSGNAIVSDKVKLTLDIAAVLDEG
ncbi:MAG TPA: YceI family protein [Solirubrobacterales bacterium]|jgi:polyisoprenoid-binding protein YceI|nr:YceI family protein [Solirubrobacterales bacterium]